MPKDYTIAFCDEEPSYRYLLNVQTGANASNIAAVVQLNPSTADSSKSDATIGKVSCWAAENHFGRILFLNLFGIRGTDPASLIGKPYLQLVGPRNDVVSIAAFQQAGTIIFAWVLSAALCSSIIVSGWPTFTRLLAAGRSMV
jgi:hypothetical protein